MVCCPPCWNWDDYPEVIAWRDRQHAQGAKASGQITGAVQEKRALWLAAQRAHEVDCARLEREIEGILGADKRLTSDCRETLRSYLRQAQDARRAKDGPEILAMLREQYAVEPIERRGWFRRFDDVGSYLQWLVNQGRDPLEDQDDEVIEAELAEEDEDAVPALPPPPRPRAELPPPPRSIFSAPSYRDPRYDLHDRVVAEAIASGERVAELSQRLEAQGRAPTTKELYQAAGLSWNGP
jgi:hypothetical protein